MLPTLVLGSVELSTYSLCGTLGSVLMVVAFCVRAHYYKIKLKESLLFSGSMVLLGMLANKGMYIIAYLPESLKHVSATVGADSWGNFFLFPLIVFAFSKISKVCFGMLADCFAPGMLVMFFWAQVGCYLNGCCFGVELFGGRFPVQAMEALCCGCLLLSVLYVDNAHDYNGRIYPIILLVHGVYRFVLDFLRDSTRELFFSRDQWLALFSVAVGIIWLRNIRGRTVVYEET